MYYLRAFVIYAAVIVISTAAVPSRGASAAARQDAREEEAKSKFEEAKALADKKDYDKALALLKELDEKYGDTKYVPANRSAIKAKAEACEKAKAARALIVDDFEEKDAESRWTPSHHWKYLKDKTASCKVVDEGRNKSKALEVKLLGVAKSELTVTGVTSNVSRALPDGIPEGVTGIQLWMRAVKPKKVQLLFKVEVKERYELRFDATEEWKEITLLWKDLKRIPKEQRITPEELAKVKGFSLTRRDGQKDYGTNFDTNNDPEAELMVLIQDVKFTTKK